MGMNPSIRRSLLLTLLTTTAAVWTVVASISYFDSRHEVEKLFDAQLAQAGRVLLAFSQHELHEEARFGNTEGSRFGETIPASHWQPAHQYEKNLAFQVWLEDNLLALLMRPNLPSLKLQ